MQYTIGSADTSFPEANLFVILVTGMSSLLAHHSAQTTIRDLVTFINQNRGKPISGQISDSPLSDPYSLWDPECREELHIQGILGYQAYLVDHTVPALSAVKFTLEPYKGPPPKKDSETEFKGRGTPMEEVLTSIICYLFEGAFERIRPRIEVLFGTKPKDWPVEVQFFRHLRNAAFHGNEFEIRPQGCTSDRSECAPVVARLRVAFR